MSQLNSSDRLKNTGRNEPCPCGSGKKYKKCHLAEDEASEHKKIIQKEKEALAAIDKEEKEEDKNDDKKIKKEAHSTQKSSVKPKNNKSSNFANIPRRTGI